MMLALQTRAGGAGQLSWRRGAGVLGAVRPALAALSKKKCLLVLRLSESHELSGRSWFRFCSVQPSSSSSSSPSVRGSRLLRRVWSRGVRGYVFGEDGSNSASGGPRWPSTWFRIAHDASRWLPRRPRRLEKRSKTAPGASKTPSRDGPPRPPSRCPVLFGSAVPV